MMPVLPHMRLAPALIASKLSLTSWRAEASSLKALLAARHSCCALCAEERALFVQSKAAWNSP